MCKHQWYRTVEYIDNEIRQFVLEAHFGIRPKMQEFTPFNVFIRLCQTCQKLQVLL